MRTLVLIDVDPDPRALDRSRPAPWRGYEAMSLYLADLRPRLEQATGREIRYN